MEQTAIMNRYYYFFRDFVAHGFLNASIAQLQACHYWQISAIRFFICHFD